MDNVITFLNNLLHDNDTVVVAVSGGPDSMALIDLIIKLDKKIQIICCHVNHNTGRVGQAEEEEYVKNYCKLNNITFEFKKIEKYESGNFEFEARKIRYKFFLEIIKKYNAKYLFTAHHADDLMETILMKIVRGSNLSGYSGFKKITDKKDYKIVRPLISVTKEEIIDYLNINKVKYYIDNTNLEDIHTRNRYRKYILPRLKEEDKNVHLKFYKFSNILSECNEYILKESLNKLKFVYDDNKLNIKKFNSLDHIIKVNILSLILNNIYNDSIVNISDAHIDLILELISKKANTMIDLPLNIKAIKNYNYITFLRNVKKTDYKIEIKDSVTLDNNHVIKVIDSSLLDNNFICRLSKSEVKFPLYVRNAFDGDKMFVKNLNGRKKVKDIFTDSKLNLQDRLNYPIVVSSDDVILWVPGIKKSKFDRTKNEKYDIILKYE